MIGAATETPLLRSTALPEIVAESATRRPIATGLLIATGIAVASRALLLLFFVLGAHLPEAARPDDHYKLRLFSGNLPLVLKSATRYGDFEWYSKVAEAGYDREPFASLPADAQRNWAFFPLQPALISLITNDAARFLVGQMLFLIGILCSFLWVERLAGRRAAVATTLLMAFFPFSIDISQFRPESALFALSSAALLLAQRGWPLGAALALAVAGFAKPNAFLTALPAWNSMAAARADWRNRPALVWGGVFVLAALIGIVAMSILSYRVAGDPLAWSKIQKAWGARLLMAPVYQLYNLLRDPLLISRAGYDFELFSWVTFALVIVSILALYRRGYTALAVFVLCYAGLTFVNFGVWVLPKHLSSATPFFLGLAVFAATSWRETVLAFLFGLFFAAAALMSGLGVTAMAI